MEIRMADILAFKRIYKVNTGAEINDDEARQRLTALVRQVELIYRPITAEQLKRQEADDEQEPGGQNIV